MGHKDTKKSKVCIFEKKLIILNGL
jgi:hypothetical protein